jgi:Hint domain
MSNTISGDFSNGYDLMDIAQNPVTVIGTISFGTNTNFAALQGEAVAAWIVTNEGTIDGGTANGIDLLAGGSVTNDTSASIGGFFGVAIQDIAGSVLNSGTIFGGAGSGAGGVLLTQGGSAANEAGGQILSGGDGIGIERDVGSVDNAGVINAGSGNAAIDLLAGGSATNEAGGTLSGAWGISIQNAATGSVLNDGVINAGAQSGVFLTGGSVTNDALGQISGTWAIAIVGAAGTVTTAGTLVSTGGTAGTAVTLAPGFANLLVVQPGAVFTGLADGGNALGSATASTLELAAAAAPGTLSALGTQFIDFGDVTIDAGASWALAGSSTADATDALVNQGMVTLSGTGPGVPAVLAVSTDIVNAGTMLVADGGATLNAPTIGAGSLGASGMLEIGGNGNLVLDAAVDSSQTVAFTASTGTLTIGEIGGFAPALISNFIAGDQIDVVSATSLEQSFDPTTDVLTLSDGLGDSYKLQFDGTHTAGDFTNAVSSVACFLAGTRIATERGEVAVEELTVGMLVRVLGAGLAPIAWIGHRRADCRRHPRPRDLWPVTVRPDAFGPGRPHRRLRLSPDHAVFFDDVLIPVRCLINGATIVQTAAESVSYWHVELARHDVILAEGLPCETYLDTGNRAAFGNGGAFVQLYADFAPRVWDAEACAPLVLGGPCLIEAKRRLLRQAVSLGYVTVDGRAVSTASTRHCRERKSPFSRG